MSNIIAPRKVRFYAPTSLRNFDFLTEPTIEGVTAESYRDDDIADGGQVLNLMDAKVRRFITAFDNLVANPQFKTDTDWSEDDGWTIDPGKPGFAVYNTAAGVNGISQSGVVTASTNYIVIIKCTKYASGTFTPKLGTASNGTITSIGITVHAITSNGTSAELEAADPSGDAEFEYMYVLDSNDYRYDLLMNSRKEIDFAMIDGQNILDVFPAGQSRSMKIYHNTVDNFSTATEIIVDEYVSGLLGKDRPFIRYNGINSYASVANNSNLNFSIFDFGIEILFRTTTSSISIILEKYDGAANGNQYAFFVDADGKLNVAIGDGATGSTATSSTLVNDGEWYHAFYIANRGGNGQIYITGVADGAADDISAVSGSLDNTDPLAFGIRSSDLSSLPFDGDMKIARLWNFNPTPDEIATIASNPSIIPQIYNDASQASLLTNGTFTGSAASWVLAGGWAYNANNIDKTAGTTGDFHQLISAMTTAPVLGERFRLEYEVISNGTTGSPQLFMLAGGTNLPASGTFELSTVVGVHTSDDFTYDNDSADRISVRLTGGSGGVIVLDNLRLVKLGATAAYLFEGISKEQDKLLDSGSNKLNADVVNAEFINTPDVDNFGYFLLRFEQINQDLYWFLSINEDNDLPIALQKYGQWILGKQYLFDISALKEYGGSISFPGVDSFETESGFFDVTKRYGSRDSFVIPLKGNSDDGWDELQEFLEVIGGRELPFYMEVVPLNAGDDPIVYKLRQASNKTPFRYVFGSGIPWRVGLEVVVDL